VPPSTLITDFFSDLIYIVISQLDWEYIERDLYIKKFTYYIYKKHYKSGSIKTTKGFYNINILTR